MARYLSNFLSADLAKAEKLVKENKYEILDQLGDDYYFGFDDKAPVVTYTTLEDDGSISWNCSCSMRRKSPCAHLAAAIMILQKEGVLPPDEENMRKAVPVLPAVKDDPKDIGTYRESYSYFDVNELLLDCKYDPKTMDQAQKNLASGRIHGVKISQTYLYDRNQMMRVEAMVEDEKLGYGEASIVLTGKQVRSFTCTCPSCYRNYSYNPMYDRHAKLCVHELTAMIALPGMLKEKRIGDATDSTGNYLMRKYTGRKDFSGEEKKAEVIIEPRLQKEYGMLSLSFKTGTAEKMYVVKNIEDFVKAMDAGEKLELGKAVTLDFSVQEVTESSRKYLTLMRNYLTDEKMRQKMTNYELDFKKSVIPLYGGSLDRFYEMELNSDIELTDKDTDERALKKRMIHLSDGMFLMDLKIDPLIGSKVDGVRVYMDMPVIFRGAQDSYALDDNLLKRIPREMNETLSDLLEVSRRNLSFDVGRYHLSDFYHQFLPAVEPYCTVHDNAEAVVGPYIPPAPAFEFFLDTEGMEIVLEAQAWYGEEKCRMRENGTSFAYRDVSSEGRVLDEIRSYFPEYDPHTETFRSSKDDDSVYRLLNTGVDYLSRLGTVSATDRFNAIRFRKKLGIRFGVSLESNVMDLDVSSSDLSMEELAEVLDSYRRKKKYHRLQNGDFVSLDDESIEMLSELLDTMHIPLRDFVSGKMEMPSYRALYLDRMLEEHESISADRDRNYRELIRSFRDLKDSDLEVPLSMKGVLRGYQEDGFRWLLTLKNAGFGGVLADDMGLGKTIQVLALLEKEKEDGRIAHTLIVTPASLVYNWEAECRRFAPDLTVNVIAGTKNERRDRIASALQYDVNVTSYDLLKRDIDLYEDLVFDYEIIDEAQYIKTPTSENAKSSKVIRAAHKFALTGTPIENRLSELWSIFDYLMPGFLYPYKIFRADLEQPIAQHKDEYATARLKRMVSPFILRRLKKDVLKDLPEKLEEVVYTQFETEQRHVYDGQVVKMKKMIGAIHDEDINRSRIQILAELTKLRQICCDPSLLLDGYHESSAKRETLLQLIENAMEGGHKMLVFSQFATMLEILEGDLKGRNISCYKITGQTSKEDRMRMVNAFNSDDTPVFLISLKAGGTGLNLTGADIVIHYDPWWNFAAQSQATDRAHRIGQTRTVTEYKIIAKDTIEEKIMEMQQAKKDLADAILSGESGNFADLSREELLDLLG